VLSSTWSWQSADTQYIGDGDRSLLAQARSHLAQARKGLIWVFGGGGPGTGGDWVLGRISCGPQGLGGSLLALLFLALLELVDLVGLECSELEPLETCLVGLVAGSAKPP
jgi:hypothetical protein